MLASKTKIYMVLEYVNGGELFEKIVSRRTGLSYLRTQFDDYAHYRGVLTSIAYRNREENSQKLKAGSSSNS